MPKPDQNQATPDIISMGIEEAMRVRLGRPLRNKIRQLYKEIYDGIPSPPMSHFVGFCLDIGVDQLKAQLRKPRKSK